MSDEPSFTLVFKGDIRDFDFNPLKTETPFGIPYAAGIGDAFAEADALREELDKIERKLSEARS